MKRLLSPESPVMHFWKKLTDFVILNVLWAVGCLPIITIGTSTAAMHRCIMQYQLQGEISIFGEFWKAYWQNIKQATGLFLVEIIAVCVLWIDVQVVWGFNTETSVLNVIWIVVLIILIVPALSLILPLQAQYDNRFFVTLKKAWLMAILHLPSSLLVTVLNLVPVLMAVFLPQVFFRSLIFWFLFGRVLLACLSDAILLRIFQQHTDNTAEYDRP